MLEPSLVQFSDKDLGKLAKVILFIYRMLGLIKVTEKRTLEKDKSLVYYESSNFTIINYYLIKMGPTREDKLTFNLLLVQVNKLPSRKIIYFRVFFNMIRKSLLRELLMLFSFPVCTIRQPDIERPD